MLIQKVWPIPIISQFTFPPAGTEGPAQRQIVAIIRLSPAWRAVFGITAEEIEVYLGSLDAPDQFRPSYEIWTIRRESWLPPFPGVKGYSRDRD